MIRQYKTSIVLIVLLALMVAGFWWLQPTTPERIGSLTFLLLVSVYSVFNRRDDVLGACVIFFAALDFNQFLFNQVLPVWIGIIGLTIIAGLLWIVLFGRYGWFLAVAATLAGLEILLILQYVNLPFSVQALLAATPFIIASQYLFFAPSNYNTNYDSRP